MTDTVPNIVYVKDTERSERLLSELDDSIDALRESNRIIREMLSKGDIDTLTLGKAIGHIEQANKGFMRVSDMMDAPMVKQNPLHNTTGKDGKEMHSTKATYENLGDQQ